MELSNKVSYGNIKNEEFVKPELAEATKISSPGNEIFYIFSLGEAMGIRFSGQKVGGEDIKVDVASADITSREEAEIAGKNLIEVKNNVFVAVGTKLSEAKNAGNSTVIINIPRNKDNVNDEEYVNHKTR